MNKRHLHLHRVRKKNLAEVRGELYLLTSFIFLCFLNFPFALGRIIKQPFPVNHSLGAFKACERAAVRLRLRAATAMGQAEVLKGCQDCMFRIAASGQRDIINHII